MRKKSLSFLFVHDGTSNEPLFHSLIANWKGCETTFQAVDCLNKTKQLPKDTQFDVAIVDLSLSSKKSLDCLYHLRDTFPSKPFVIVVDEDDIEHIDTILGFGFCDVIYKADLDENTFYRSVRYAVEKESCSLVSKDIRDSDSVYLSAVAKINKLIKSAEWTAA